MSKTAITSEEEYTDLVRLWEEWETAHKCMDICSRLNENMTIIDDYATGDALRFMVSTNGQIIQGKNRGLDWRTRQIGGHLSDTSVQQLSRDMARINLQSSENAIPPSRGSTSFVPGDRTENEATIEFRERYGQGIKLTPR